MNFIISELSDTNISLKDWCWYELKIRELSDANNYMEDWYCYKNYNQ